MALRTRDIAKRYIELLERDPPENALKRAYRHLDHVRMDEVRALLVQSLAPLHRSAYRLLQREVHLTSRELADEFGIEINHASNILSDLDSYGLVERFMLHEDLMLLNKRQDLIGYSGHIYRVRRKKK